MVVAQVRPDSPFTIKAVNEVANQYAFLGRVAEEVAHRAHIVTPRKSARPEDDATLNAELKLATCLITLDGRLRPNRFCPRRRRRSAAFGEEDPQTLAALAWSASVAKRLGRLPEPAAPRARRGGLRLAPRSQESAQGLSAALQSGGGR